MNVYLIVYLVGALLVFVCVVPKYARKAQTYFEAIGYSVATTFLALIWPVYLVLVVIIVVCLILGAILWSLKRVFGW